MGPHDAECIAGRELRIGRSNSLQNPRRPLLLGPFAGSKANTEQHYLYGCPFAALAFGSVGVV
jgi:hypothetical protein